MSGRRNRRRRLRDYDPERLPKVLCSDEMSALMDAAAYKLCRHAANPEHPMVVCQPIDDMIRPEFGDDLAEAIKTAFFFGVACGIREQCDYFAEARRETALWNRTKSSSDFKVGSLMVKQRMDWCRGCQGVTRQKQQSDGAWLCRCCLRIVMPAPTA